jgi:hypothetical protein
MLGEREECDSNVRSIFPFLTSQLHLITKVEFHISFGVSVIP